MRLEGTQRLIKLLATFKKRDKKIEKLLVFLVLENLGDVLSTARSGIVRRGGLQFSSPVKDCCWQR